jgi:hypothetical protein
MKDLELLKKMIIENNNNQEAKAQKIASSEENKDVIIGRLLTIIELSNATNLNYVNHLINKAKVYEL